MHLILQITFCLLKDVSRLVFNVVQVCPTSLRCREGKGLGTLSLYSSVRLKEHPLSNFRTSAFVASHSVNVVVLYCKSRATFLISFSSDKF